MKICTGCNLPKEESEFHKQKVGKGGLTAQCRDCRKTSAAKRYLESKNRILAKSKEYYEKHKEVINARHIAYYEANKQELNAKSLQNYYADWENKRRKADESTKRHWGQRLEYLNKYRRIKWGTNPSYRMHGNISRRLRESLNAHRAKGPIWNFLGYALSELINHLQGQFVEGMSWENYGKVWHVDHIIPLSTFNDDSIMEAWQLNNLQPLFARDNMKKGKKIITMIGGTKYQ